MANNAALQLHEDLETYEHHLETFKMMAEMHMVSKEACQTMAGQTVGLLDSINEFQAGRAMNDGMSKQASAMLARMGSSLVSSINGGDMSHIAETAGQLKEALAQARRTYLSREALNRMTII
jgi:hypothetical protein